MLVGGSGVGKTERLIPLSVMPDVILESSITGPAALLSGTAKKERAKTATGGLLRKVPLGGGVLVLKDFTSILDMHRDARAEVLAALREIYDGRWDRSIGTDGGQTLTWRGHLGLVAGCTTAIDSAHAVMSAMGTRFLLVRLRHSDELAAAAFDHVGTEAAMRTELRDSVHALFASLTSPPHDKGPAQRSLIALATFVARARSPVDRDTRSELRLVLDAEAPTRIVKMLTQLWCAAGVLGLDAAAAWALVQRLGLDSIPKLRRAALDYLESQESPVYTSDIAEMVEHPVQTTRRALEDLMVHHVIRKMSGGPGRADLWQLTAQTRDWLSTLRTVPVLSGDIETPPDSHKPKNTQTDKTGTVSEDLDHRS
jgi:hypothetical protein